MVARGVKLRGKSAQRGFRDSTKCPGFPIMLRNVPDSPLRLEIVRDSPGFRMNCYIRIIIIIIWLAWICEIVSGDADQQFVDCKLLNEIIGNDHQIIHMYREMETLITEMVAGRALVPQVLIRMILRKRGIQINNCV